MYKTKTIIAAAICSLLAFTQANAQEGSFLGEMRGMNHKQKGHAYQGMDVWNDYVFSCQNQGIGTIYRLTGDGFDTISQFKLASFNPVNHANVASFGIEKICKDDPFPVVYISHCHRKPIDGKKDLLFVERISPDMKSSSLVQTIFYNDVNKDFGYALQWVIDRKNKLLYGYGNTIDNTNTANRHRVIKFRIPKLSDGEFITLNPEDALENYVIEEVSGFKFNPIGQGLFVSRDKLYMPTRFGTEKAPSILYIWDLKKKAMEVVDLSKETTGELEDISVISKNSIIYNKDSKTTLLLQSQDGLFTVTL